jgi:septum formation protein
LRVLASDVPEQVGAEEGPTQYLERIVRAKLEAVARSSGLAPCAGVLVADTNVVIDDQVLGKPRSVTDAECFIRRLVGRTHLVRTRYAVALAAAPTIAVRSRTVDSRVTMRPAEPEEIRGYARTGEGMDKAGAYAAQGLGAFLVERIDGSHSNVIGLPACEVILDLKAAGLLEQFP